jgi:hypothetical protein
MLEPPVLLTLASVALAARRRDSKSGIIWRGVVVIEVMAAATPK